jgi:hypothetical protein
MLRVRNRCCVLLLFSTCLIAATGIIPPRALSQRRHRKSETPTQPVGAPHTPQIKPDFMTLRYKPQAGTLLYNIHTRIDQNVRTDRDAMHGVLRSDAQLAFRNVAIDYKMGLWSFDESFTNFEVTGQELSGDSLLLQENFAVNRVTELTYDMSGNELSRVVKDTLRLLNAEAQTNAYFFEPPRMLIPLPARPVTYGDTWTEHREDTIPVRDTVNIGTTTGAYIYDVSRSYRFTRLSDTLEKGDSSNRYLAIIVATDTGTFQGYQTNSLTKVTTKSSGPISGADTTILDLFSGSVVKRTLDMSIPARVEVSSAPSSLPDSSSTIPPPLQPFTDILTIHSIVTLDESNERGIRNGE